MWPPRSPGATPACPSDGQPPQHRHPEHPQHRHSPMPARHRQARRGPAATRGRGHAVNAAAPAIRPSAPPRDPLTSSARHQQQRAGRRPRSLAVRSRGASGQRIGASRMATAASRFGLKTVRRRATRGCRAGLRRALQRQYPFLQRLCRGDQPGHQQRAQRPVPPRAAPRRRARRKEIGAEQRGEIEQRCQRAVGINADREGKQVRARKSQQQRVIRLSPPGAGWGRVSSAVREERGERERAAPRPAARGPPRRAPGRVRAAPPGAAPAPAPPSSGQSHRGSGSGLVAERHRRFRVRRPGPRGAPRLAAPSGSQPDQLMWWQSWWRPALPAHPRSLPVWVRRRARRDASARTDTSRDDGRRSSAGAASLSSSDFMHDLRAGEIHQRSTRPRAPGSTSPCPSQYISNPRPAGRSAPRLPAAPAGSSPRASPPRAACRGTSRSSGSRARPRCRGQSAPAACYAGARRASWESGGSYTGESRPGSPPWARQTRQSEWCRRSAPAA